MVWKGGNNMFSLNVRRIGIATIIDGKGRITTNEDAELLRSKIQSLFSQGDKQILINMTDVDYIDSGGVAELVAASKKADKKYGGRFKIFGFNKRTEEKLKIQHIYELFEVFENETKTLESFSR
jgi:anti-sigma B factor antagonist